ncbi:MAG: hypothetical protein ABH884_01725 [Candidatus Komeilibacteria bacterium]
MKYSTKIKHYKKGFISLIIITLLAVVIVSVLMPQQYEAKAKLLIVQKQAAGQDAYLASKAAEKIGMIFGEVVYGTSFFDKIWRTGIDIGSEWGETEKERRELWEKAIEVGMVPRTSIFEIKTYSTSKAQATHLAEAVTYVLLNSGSDYHGAGDQIIVKLIDGPIISERPVKPDIAINAVLGLLAGIIIGLLYVYLKPIRIYQKEASQQMIANEQVRENDDPSGFLMTK